MSGIILFFIVGFSETISFLFLKNTKNIQSFMIFINYLLASIISFFIGVNVQNGFDFSFLKDGFFYFLLILEFLVIHLYKKNYNLKNDFSYISFSLFSTIYLIFPISYTYNLLFDFNHEVKFPYNSLSEILFFSSLFFTLSLFYFYDKIKFKSVESPQYLILLAIVISHAMFFGITMMQIYNSFLVYSTILFVISIFYFITSFKDIKSVLNDKNDLKNGMIYALISNFSMILAFFAVKFLAVEFITLFKRNAQMLSSFFIDRFFFKKSISLKDISIMIIILIISIIIYLRYES